MSRELRIEEDPSGLISAAGGKLTTYRSMGKAIVDRVLPLEKVSEAHRLLAAGEIFGKLVLEMPPG